MLFNPNWKIKRSKNKKRLIYAPERIQFLDARICALAIETIYYINFQLKCSLTYILADLCVSQWKEVAQARGKQVNIIIVIIIIDDSEHVDKMKKKKDNNTNNKDNKKVIEGERNTLIWLTWFTYLKKGLVDFCIGRYLNFVEFLVEFRSMIVDIVNGHDNTCGRR